MKQKRYYLAYLEFFEFFYIYGDDEIVEQLISTEVEGLNPNISINDTRADRMLSDLFYLSCRIQIVKRLYDSILSYEGKINLNSLDEAATNLSEYLNTMYYEASDARKKDLDFVERTTFNKRKYPATVAAIMPALLGLEKNDDMESAAEKALKFSQSYKENRKRYFDICLSTDNEDIPATFSSFIADAEIKEWKENS